MWSTHSQCRVKILNIAQMAITFLIRHGYRPYNYVYNDIFGSAVSPGLTKILPIEKCIIFFETPCMMNVKLRPAPTRVNAILGYPCVMVRNGYFIPIFFLLTSGIVFRTLLGFRKSWSG